MQTFLPRLNKKWLNYLLKLFKLDKLIDLNKLIALITLGGLGFEDQKIPTRRTRTTILPFTRPCRFVKAKRPMEKEKMVSPGLPCGRQKIFLFNLKEWGGAEKDCATSA